MPTDTWAVILNGISIFSESLVPHTFENSKGYVHIVRKPFLQDFLVIFSDAILYQILEDVEHPV